ncbi:MAG: lipid A biosynthesis acyltransferase [Bacteroidales bacterium]|nr:lipid A biosynthesis acyltransferase [Bacteroidales bacterium]
MHAWLVRLLKVLDVRILYVFSDIFVIPFFMLFNSGAGYVRRFYREGLGMSRFKAWRMSWKNLCKFSQAVIDKFAMYAGKKFKLEIVGYEYFKVLAERPEGFVQLSSHLGNYEIAGYTLVARQKRLNAVVFAGEKESVMESRQKMFEGTNVRMIPVREDMSHLFLIDKALSDGETVSIPADRVFGSPKVLKASFLGKEASLPAGPFSVAAMRGLDVICVNVLKTAAKAYKICVTPLPYDRQAGRKTQLSQLAAGYSAEIERLVREYPGQWYNYFDFWAQ